MPQQVLQFTLCLFLFCVDFLQCKQEMLHVYIFLIEGNDSIRIPLICCMRSICLFAIRFDKFTYLKKFDFRYFFANIETKISHLKIFNPLFQIQKENVTMFKCDLGSGKALPVDLILVGFVFLRTQTTDCEFKW